MSAAREATVRAVLNEIVDPCSDSSGTPIGLVDMGIVAAVDVDGGAVSVELLPTFAGCMFIPSFEDEIERRVGALEWCDGITVTLASASEIWDETRMAESARERLRVRRAALRKQLPVT